MRIFTASLATETNTFAPMPTGLQDFRDRTYFPAGTHPDGLQMFAGPLWALRQVAPDRAWTVIEGLVAAAVPSGRTSRAAYETLRDELLDDLRAALPVEMVLLGLHGAMVADGYDDCEGDLIARIRDIAGPDVVIGATLDPHAHLSDAMVASANILICWKEYPHTDIRERALELVEACRRIAAGEIQARAIVVDTGMVAMLHTNEPAAKGFVERLYALERRKDVIAASIVHGFGWGDVPDMGTKVLIYRDDACGTALPPLEDEARQLATDLYRARDTLTSPGLSIDDAIEQGLSRNGSIVLADGADNPGGGAPGDSTFVLHRLIARDVSSAALGPLWDPGAVRIAMDADVGARLAMRIGGKVSPLSGDPVDADWEIVALVRNMTIPGLAGAPANLGDCALIRHQGVEVVVSSLRCQGFSPELFERLGCAIQEKDIVVVKSAQHFRSAFEPHTAGILYIDGPGVFSRHIENLRFRHHPHDRWPLRHVAPAERAEIAAAQN